MYTSSASALPSLEIPLLGLAIQARDV